MFTLQNLTKVCCRILFLAVVWLMIGMALRSDPQYYLRGESPGVPWSCSDNMGRLVIDSDEAGFTKKNHFVGIFYFLWLNESIPSCSWTPGPYDLSKLIPQLPLGECEKPEKSTSELWAKAQTMYYWGEPIYGYYSIHDPWVLRRHIYLLIDAGIDFLFFDTTNALTYPDAYLPLCKLLKELKEEGESVPQVCFMLHTRTNETAQQLWNEIYGTGEYDDLLFQVDGKPLLIGNPDDITNEELHQRLTLRRAHWPFVMENTQNAWHWEAAYPQPYGWSRSSTEPEQVNVSVAQNLRRSETPKGAEVTNMSSGMARGRSFSARLYTASGDQPFYGMLDTPVFTHDEKSNHSLLIEGANFIEQWERALELNPPYVTVTGWNEWIAGRWQRGDSFVFVDQFNREYSRDIEPMRGGHGDYYYSQLIEGVRRYKGAPPRPVASVSQTISLGDFAAWQNITPELTDHRGETVPRDHMGTGGVRYTNHSGRNDIVAVKATRDDSAFYFYVRTAEPIIPAKPDGLSLLINTDRNLATGFVGGDYLIGRSYTADTTSVERHRGEADSWNWRQVGEVSYAVNGTELMWIVPYKTLGLNSKKGTFNQISFKILDNIEDSQGQVCLNASGEIVREWSDFPADNTAKDGTSQKPIGNTSKNKKTKTDNKDKVSTVTPQTLYLNGDVAPESRFFYTLKEE